MPTEDPIMRVCTKCKIAKPLDDFTFRPGGKYGRASRCKICKNGDLREHYAKHPEKSRKRGRDNHAANRAVNIKKMREYKAANAESVRAAQKAYLQKHGDKRRACHRNWYERNREYCIQKSLDWALANPERFKARIKEQRRLYRSRMRANGGKMTRAEWAQILHYYGYSCAYCLQHESVVGTLEVEHMLPVKRGGSAAPENCVPACRKCNAEKHWLTPMEYLSKLGRRESMAQMLLL